MSEATLLRHLDGELEGGVAEDVRSHLEGCARCRGRLERLAARDRAVRAWLRRHDPEPPTRASRRPGAGPSRRRGAPSGEAGDDVPGSERASWVRWAAAAAVILAVGGALAGPALGWILDGLRSLVGGAEPRPARVAPPGGAPGGALAFVSAGEELRITFSSPETRGSLAIETAPDSLVTLTPPSGAVELAVESGRLEVRNAGAPAGAYRLAVPAWVRTLRIRVRGAGEMEVELPVGEGGLPPGRRDTLALPPEG